MMETLSKFYYHKAKIAAWAVFFSIASLLLVAFGIFCFVRWDLGFMFTDWKGYMMLGVYGFITLSIIYDMVDYILKLGKAYSGIPAFGVGSLRFVIYDRHGMETSIPFDDCERVRFKSEFKFRGAPPALKLIIVYRDKARQSDKTRIEIPLDELNQSQSLIERQLKEAFSINNYEFQK
ncbi:MAG: hypothetical protein IJ160_12490 [Muribaculaceae bacterium]|nr:hypothetical protein [Muribaculaceae bacterium]